MFVSIERAVRPMLVSAAEAVPKALANLKQKLKARASQNEHMLVMSKIRDARRQRSNELPPFIQAGCSPGKIHS